MAKKTPPPTRRQKIVKHAHHYILKLNYGGLLTALIFYRFSALPSLLPRPWLYQGAISGISLAIGYGVGTALSSLFRWSFQLELPVRAKLFAWRGLRVIGPVVFLMFLFLGSSWQREVHQLVGETPPDSRYLLRTLLLTLVMFALLLGAARSIRRLTQFLIARLDKVLPRRASMGLGVILVSLFFFWLVSGVFANFFVTTSNRIYRSRNATTPEGVSQPQAAERSGSKASLIAWDTIGFQGKSFVAGGPTQQQMQKLGSTATKEQIRVYAGLDSADTPTARAQLAVAELKRTKAFERKLLVLATPTGTGWLEPQSVDSIEYMYGGDTAIVAQQYSYLPSWISFLVDKQNAQDAGRALYDAVFAEWSKLPPENRPKLIAYGLSLGSFGGQSAYTGVGGMQATVDGALFMGTPNDTDLWRTITNDRDKGSPQWQPTYQKGTAVRFAATNADILRDQTKWQAPRILYMQHASDPVVWFGFDLALNKPDWLREKRGPDVAPQVRWYPFVTFFQVAIDQFFGTTVPNGHGHNYGNTIVNAWGSIATPTDWNSQKAQALQNVISSYSND